MTVEELLVEVGRLRREEQLRLIDGILRLLHNQHAGTRSITELRGLGKQVWEGVDAQQYVLNERRSWGG